MHTRPALLLVVLGLLLAGAWCVHARTTPEARAASAAPHECSCANTDCECVGVCDCRRASCCARATIAREPAAAQAPAIRPFARAMQATHEAPRDPAAPHVRRRHCGSHEPPAAASSASGAAGLAQACTPHERVLRTSAPAPAIEFGTHDSRRPAPPSPPPERAQA